jgi:hypothetical protein
MPSVSREIIVGSGFECEGFAGQGAKTSNGWHTK